MKRIVVSMMTARELHDWLTHGGLKHIKVVGK